MRMTVFRTKFIANSLAFLLVLSECGVTRELGWGRKKGKYFVVGERAEGTVQSENSENNRKWEEIESVNKQKRGERERGAE